MIASPVDRAFAKFRHRNDAQTCLDGIMSADDIVFTLADKTESLVKFRLPNDSEFKRLLITLAIALRALKLPMRLYALSPTAQRRRKGPQRLTKAVLRARQE
jgi:hypothetical protein